MSTHNTLINLESYCMADSGSPSVWSGKSGTYQWSQGKETVTGLLNGVVRKLAGIDASGKQIWVVAGSFKIASDGSILRFTGLPKSVQKDLSKVITVPVTTKVAEMA